MASSDTTQIVINVSAAVLGAETNATRFEGFSRAVVSKIEGDALVLSTSTSWDLGRDGVGLGRASGLYVCCSLRDDVDAKALGDIQRLASTTKGIKRVYFCSNHSLSEHRRAKIEAALSEEVDHSFSVVCLGSAQLLESARLHDSKIVNEIYGAEISNTLRAIRPDVSGESEIRGLRLALISSAADDSGAIRSEVYRNAILDVLKDGKDRSISNLSKDVSESLHLHRNISEAALKPHLEALVSESLLAVAVRRYSISETGLQSIARQEQDAALRHLSGRQAVRDALGAALGTQLLLDHFDRIWAVFEEKMAQYFMARGDALVAEISDIILNNEDSAKIETLPSTLSFLDDLADAVADTSSHMQQREELRVAVKDLFSDRTSVATNWLVKVCASFVAACALGLEHSSSLAIEKLLSKTTLVLDTDVVLSLLGAGEPEHQAVETIVTRWAGLGGRVLVAEPVLEEVAYHAHIAQQDYDAVANRLPGTADDRLHVIENVFVRAFAELLNEKKVRHAHWRSFIGQFKGSSSRDWSSVFGHASTEYSLELLPPRSSSEAELEQQVQAFLSTDAALWFSGDALRNAKDKARRDAQLYAALVHRVRVVKAEDPGATCILVSSARRLAKAESQFHSSGEKQLIVSISSILYLVSMLPEVSLGLTAMKAFLFDERRRVLSTELERTLVRLVRSSQEYAMPWAKRGMLMRSVRDKLIEDSQNHGNKNPSRGQLADIEREALSEKNRARTMEILRDSLDSIAVDTRTAKENIDLKARIKELEERLNSRPGLTPKKKRQPGS